MKPLLDIRQLCISFKTYNRTVQAVRKIDFQILPGEIVAIVGESGCGKSVTAQSIMGLLPRSSIKELSGEILFDGENLLSKPEKELRQIRGKKIGMVFQDPLTSLNPTMKVGYQITEVLRQHESLSQAAAWKRAIELLDAVGIPNPTQRVSQYPFEFSGGMRQRVIIAMAIACNPKLLIADEPTTALDVTIQEQILDLLKDLQKKLGMSILLITHDLGIVAGMCDRVIVMYAGQVAEMGTVEDIFYRPQHPYTQALLQAIPRLDKKQDIPLEAILGSPPDLSHPPSGCAFHPRCPYAMPVCCQHAPPLEGTESHAAACWLLEKNRRNLDTSY